MEKIIYKIQTNKIKCKKCGDIIESKYIHDFKMCKCNSVGVDGGHEYLKKNRKRTRLWRFIICKKIRSIKIDDIFNIKGITTDDIKNIRLLREAIRNKNLMTFFILKEGDKDNGFKK